MKPSIFQISTATPYEAALKPMKKRPMWNWKFALLGFGFLALASCAHEQNHRKGDDSGLHRHGMRSVGEYRPGAYHRH